MKITRVVNPGADRPVEYDEAPCPRADLPGPCHIYRGAKISNGYGNFFVDGRSALVHRVVWERTRGPIPDGMEIDHLCRVKACCSPDHLRVVTHQVNSTENSDCVGAVNKVKTHCPAGHAYDKKNTRINRRGGRVCRKCHCLRGIAAQKRRTAARAAGGVK